jgi:hypothetical protein
MEVIRLCIEKELDISDYKDDNGYYQLGQIDMLRLATFKKLNKIKEDE